jgi:hypothetical protein
MADRRIMAIYGRKEKKLHRKVKKAKPYLKYFDEMRRAGKQPMTKFHWEKQGKTGKALSRLTRRERKSVGSPD